MKSIPLMCMRSQQMLTPCTYQGCFGGALVILTGFKLSRYFYFWLDQIVCRNYYDKLRILNISVYFTFNCHSCCRYFCYGCCNKYLDLYSIAYRAIRSILCRYNIVSNMKQYNQIQIIIIKYALHYLCAIILSSSAEAYYELIDVGLVILAAVSIYADVFSVNIRAAASALVEQYFP